MQSSIGAKAFPRGSARKRRGNEKQENLDRRSENSDGGRLENVSPFNFKKAAFGDAVERTFVLHTGED